MRETILLAAAVGIATSAEEHNGWFRYATNPEVLAP
jgi:hypothetical protein